MSRYTSNHIFYNPQDANGPSYLPSSAGIGLLLSAADFVDNATFPPRHASSLHSENNYNRYHHTYRSQVPQHRTSLGHPTRRMPDDSRSFSHYELATTSQDAFSTSFPLHTHPSRQSKPFSDRAPSNINNTFPTSSSLFNPMFPSANRLPNPASTSEPVQAGLSAGDIGRPYSQTTPHSRQPSNTFRRTQTAVSCLRCRATHKKCDEQRPCGRCVRIGKLDCEDAPPRGAKDKSSQPGLYDLPPLEDLYIGPSTATTSLALSGPSTTSGYSYLP